MSIAPKQLGGRELEKGMKEEELNAAGKDRFGLAHSTLELETPETACAGATAIGHPV